MYYFPDKARYWQKIAIFSYALHSTPSLGSRRWNITIPFGMEKAEWYGYPTVKKGLMICLAVSSEYRSVSSDKGAIQIRYYYYYYYYYRQTGRERRTDILRQHSSRYA